MAGLPRGTHPFPMPPIASRLTAVLADRYRNFWKLPAWAPLRADAEGRRLLTGKGV